MVCWLAQGTRSWSQLGLGLPICEGGRACEVVARVVSLPPPPVTTFLSDALGRPDTLQLGAMLPDRQGRFRPSSGPRTPARPRGRGLRAEGLRVRAATGTWAGPGPGPNPERGRGLGGWGWVRGRGLRRGHGAGPKPERGIGVGLGPGAGLGAGPEAGRGHGGGV